MQLDFPEVFSNQKAYTVDISRVVITFEFQRFRNLLLGELDGLSESLEAIRKHTSEQYGWSIEHGEFKVKISSGNEFKFVLSPKKFVNNIARYRLRVWGMGNKLILIDKEIPLNLESRGNFIDGIGVVFNNYHNNSVRCFRCSASIDLMEAFRNKIDNKPVCQHCRNKENE